jgi:hypothetical protein
MRKIINITIVIVVILIIAGLAYWYLFLLKPAQTPATAENQNPETGFVPLNRATTPSSGQNNVSQGTNAATSTKIVTVVAPLPVLRLLSATPVGGYGASTTASTTIVRWIDRGRGNIYEARGDSLDIATISNTLLPRVYESWWNKNDLSFVGQYLGENSDKVTTIIANILKRAALGTTTRPITETAYELRGKIISGNVITAAASPKRDRILVVASENNRASGYISNFDGSKQVQLFDLPFTQLTAEWPEDNTVAVTTKASAYYSGYLYFVNVKTGAISEILGNMPGLATKVSRDATKVLYSSAAGSNDKILTAIYDIKNQKTTSVIFRALADKCVWSSKFREEVYCAVSSQIPDGIYPDDWYLGKTSFIDNIWLLNSNTGEVHQVANLLNQGNALIDAYNLQLDSIDDFLFFMNKNDLSLWSLDLVSSH